MHETEYFICMKELNETLLHFLLELLSKSFVQWQLSVYLKNKLLSLYGFMDVPAVQFSPVQGIIP